MTTQVPQFAFELMKEFGLNGKVLVTQPRKLAAKDYATRAAEELDVTVCTVYNGLKFPISVEPVGWILHP